jgi:hypothetical protein
MTTELYISAHGSINIDEAWFVVPKGKKVILYNFPGFILYYCNLNKSIDKMRKIIEYKEGELMYNIFFNFEEDEIIENNDKCDINFIKSNVKDPFKLNFNNKSNDIINDFFGNCINNELKNKFKIDFTSYNISLIDIIKTSSNEIKNYHILSCLPLSKPKRCREYIYNIDKPKLNYYPDNTIYISIPSINFGSIDIFIISDDIFRINNTDKIPNEFYKHVDVYLITYIDEQHLNIYYETKITENTNENKDKDKDLIIYLKKEKIDDLVKYLKKSYNFTLSEKKINNNNNFKKVIFGKYIESRSMYDLLGKSIINPYKLQVDNRMSINLSKLEQEIINKFKGINVIEELPEYSFNENGDEIKKEWNKNRNIIQINGNHICDLFKALSQTPKGTLRKLRKDIEISIINNNNFGCAKARTIDLMLIDRMI